jgi:hypothetical protein
MKQFEFNLKNFLRGLRTYKYMPYNSGLLTKAFGYRAEDMGLIPIGDVNEYVTTDELYALGISQLIPNVRFVNSLYYCLMINFTKVYSIDRMTGDITDTGLNLPFDPIDYTLTVLDFDSVIYLHTGGKFYKYDGVTLTSCGEALAELSCNTSCQGMERVFIGGLDTASILTDYNRVTTFLDSRSIWWSKIGSGNFIGEIGETLQDAEQQMLSTETGFMTFGGIGDVVKILPYYNSIIVYGTVGIFELKQVVEPVITMSKKHLSFLGIKNATKVCQGKNRQLFITNKNEIYFLQYNQFQVLELDRVDCKAYLDEMDDNIKLSYNEEEDEFYIASNSYTLVVTTKGITQYDYVIHDVVNIAGRTLPIKTKTNKIGDQS